MHITVHKIIPHLSHFTFPSPPHSCAHLSPWRLISTAAFCLVRTGSSISCALYELEVQLLCFPLTLAAFCSYVLADDGVSSCRNSLLQLCFKVFLVLLLRLNFYCSVIFWYKSFVLLLMQFFIYWGIILLIRSFSSTTLILRSIPNWIACCNISHH